MVLTSACGLKSWVAFCNERMLLSSTGNEDSPRMKQGRKAISSPGLGTTNHGPFLLTIELNSYSPTGTPSLILDAKGMDFLSGSLNSMITGEGICPARWFTDWLSNSSFS